MIKFDLNGNLFPHKTTSVDLETFKRMFVDDFENSERRTTIFESYLGYIERMKSIFENPFSQWIDGSFVTNKLNTNDIDVVTFINFEDYRKNEKRLNDFRKERNGKSNFIDGYFIIQYPENHPKYFLYEMDSKQWLFTFSFSRDKKPKGITQKGIIQIDF